jgi:hypothetical protein
MFIWLTNDTFWIDKDVLVTSWLLLFSQQLHHRSIDWLLPLYLLFSRIEPAGAKAKI